MDSSPSLPLTSCETLEKSFNSSESQFPHPRSGDNKDHLLEIKDKIQAQDVRIVADTGRRGLQPPSWQEEL